MSRSAASRQARAPPLPSSYRRASKGLIHRAIFQSGGYTPFATKATAEDQGKKFAAAAGCTAGDIAKCLRALPAAKIAALAGTASAISPLVSDPLLDGTVIPQSVDRRFPQRPVQPSADHVRHHP